MYSLLRYLMEVDLDCELHVPAAISTGTLYLLGWGGPQSWSGCGGGEKNHCFSGRESPARRLVTMVTELIPAHTC
jgi:hypothetical protein